MPNSAKSNYFLVKQYLCTQIKFAFGTFFFSTTMFLFSQILANFAPNVPNISYVKASDVYTGTCMIFLFLAVVGKRT